MLQEEILTLMLRYVGAAAPVYSLFLPLAVHIMVVSTHSVFSTVTIAIKVQSTEFNSISSIKPGTLMVMDRGASSATG